MCLCTTHNLTLLSPIYPQMGGCLGACVESPESDVSATELANHIRKPPSNNQTKPRPAATVNCDAQKTAELVSAFNLADRQWDVTVSRGGAEFPQEKPERILDDFEKSAAKTHWSSSSSCSAASASEPLSLTVSRDYSTRLTCTKASERTTLQLRKPHISVRKGDRAWVTLNIRRNGQPFFEQSFQLLDDKDMLERTLEPQPLDDKDLFGQTSGRQHCRVFQTESFEVALWISDVFQTWDTSTVYWFPSLSIYQF